MGRVVAVVAAVAAAMMAAPPVWAAEEPPKGTVVVSMVGLGGTYTGITYQSLWQGSRPATAYVPSWGHTMQATAYFTNLPEFGGPAWPISGTMQSTYQWRAHCNVPGTGSRTFALTSPRTIDVPVHPSASIFRVIPPSAVVTDTVTLPALECWRIYINFSMHGTAKLDGSDGLFLNYFTPGPQHEFAPERASNGDIRLYRIATSGELEEVQRTGNITTVPQKFFQYYFTSCAAAREALGVVIGSFQPGALGLVQVSGPPSLAGSVVGATARQAGAKDVVVWGLEHGTATALTQAQVVSDGGSPVDGCSA
ncbi:hypothetical protein [Cellulomonas flavigena]|uniref:hypothetical protein n=1 Tax=Cellulomonas flavigena TaxID=1711 RepID=UPI0011D1F058|nr:hypothetical protein [Cellulomonas flavigena]